MHKLVFLLFALLLVFCVDKGTNSRDQGNYHGNQAKIEVKPVPAPTPFDYFGVKRKESKEESVIWKGHSGNFDFKWTTRDLYVTKDGKTESLFSEYSKKWIKSVAVDQKDVTDIISFRLVSLVGNLVSIEIYESIHGDHSPTTSTEASWVTVDLTKAGDVALSYTEDKGVNRNANLTDYFSDQDVITGLLFSEPVSNALRKKGSNNPKSLADFFPDKYLALNDSGTLQLNSLLVNKFTFVDCTPSTVTVGLEILDAYNFHESHVERLYITLPMPPDLSESLQKAQKRQEGFLDSFVQQGNEADLTTIVFRR